jgi:NTP-dependent ternary system trypsin peptidase co-occuring protein
MKTVVARRVAGSRASAPASTFDSCGAILPVLSWLEVSMPDLVEFSLADGSVVVVEAEELQPTRVTRGGRQDGGVVEKADRTFEAAVERVGPASAALVERLRSLADQPDEIEVEFGVKLNAEAGAIIARTSGEANFRIAVRWKRG